MTHPFRVLAIVGCLSTSALAEEQQITVSTTDSGRLYADYTFGDCCTLDAWDSQPSSIWTDDCDTLGGYCSAGRDIANWMFPIPEFPEGAELLEVRLKVYRQTGSPGNATLKIRGSESSDLGIYNAQQAFGNPDQSQNAYFSYAQLHSFELPLSHFVDPFLQSHVIVGIYRSNNLGFVNSGANAPKLEFTFDVDTAPPCDPDLDGNGTVDASDLGIFLAYWGPKPSGGDFNDDGVANAADLGILLASWGTCSPGDGG